MNKQVNTFFRFRNFPVYQEVRVLRKELRGTIKKYFPKEVHFTQPEGGMFLWVTLPGNISSMKLFNIAIENKVAFVPGHPFYIGKNETNTLRLNFSSVDENEIEIGMKRLGKALKMLISK